MCAKLPATAYYTQKIKKTNRQVLLQELASAPIKKIDYAFMLDIIEGVSYKELAEKYHKSEARIYQWKRTLFERLHQYDMALYTDISLAKAKR